MSAGAVRAGGAFVEIFAKDGQFQQAMTRVQNRVQTVGQTMQRMGTGMSIGGAALGAPMLLAGRQAAGFEDAILAMKGAAGLADAQVKQLADTAKGLGSEMGVSPTLLANAFLELAKAGMSVDDILAGAGKSAAEFAKASGVEADRAATFMKTSMNVFGVSAQEAVDTLSAAADSSETSIEAMVESFSQAASTGESFNQSLFGLSQAFAVLAGAGIVGEEAGTAVKTMLTKLVAPTQDAEEALGRLGLKIADFRDEAGQLLPMQQIAGVFEKALGGMKGDPGEFMASQQALVDVFEQRGIKVITAFANAGVGGFQRIGEEMGKATSVSEKFQIQMSGISGQISRLNQGVEQMSIAFGEAISGPLKQTTDILVGLMSVVTQLITDFPMLATTAAAIAAGLVAIGVAAIAAGIAMKGFATVTAALSLLAGPQGWIAAAAIGAALGILAAEASMAAEELEKARKEVEGLGNAGKGAAGAKNAVKPDENRKPMEGDPFAKKKAAEALAKEDAEFEDAQLKAVERMQELHNSVVDEVRGLGDAAFQAAVNFQEDMREIIDKIKAGILTGPGATALADQAKAVFEADLERVRKSLEEKTRDFGDSLGTFGDGAAIGIGPKLAKFIEKVVIEPRQRAAGVGAGPGVNRPGVMDDTHAPNPEWVRQQQEKLRKVTESAASSVSMPEGFRSGMQSAVNAEKEHMKVSQEGNRLLGVIAANSNKNGLVFQ